MAQCFIYSSTFCQIPWHSMLYSKIPLWLNFLILALKYYALRTWLLSYYEEDLFYFNVAKNLMYHHRCSLCLNIQMFPFCPKMLSRMQICWFWDSCWLVWGSPLLMKSFFCSLFSVSLPTQVHRCFSAFSSVSMETSPKLWALICSQCFLFLAVFSTTCHSL